MNSIGELTGDCFKINIPSDRETGFVSRLHLGEILEGRILESLGNRKVVVNFNGTEVFAEAGNSLSPGTDIVVKVAQLMPKVELNLLSHSSCPTDKCTSLLKRYLSNYVPLGKAIETLQRILGEEWSARQLSFDKTLYRNLETVLSNIIFDEGKMFKPEYLSNFLTQSGLLYESKLKRLLMKSLAPQSLKAEINSDLKGLLLKISKYPYLTEGFNHMVRGEDGLSGERADLLLKTVRELVDNIELNQLTNCVRKKEGDYLYIQIPLAFQDGINSAELYIYCNRRRRTAGVEKEDFNLVFLLSLEGLGSIKIDTNIKKRHVWCRIAVEDNDVARFINVFLPGLEDRLSALDYIVERIDCVVLEDPSQVKVSFGENFASESFKFVDVKV